MSAATGPESAARPRRRGPTRAGQLRREQILLAAGQAFAEHGFHGTGIEEIAAEAGVSGPALYRHFPSKYAVFAECARSLAVGLLEAWPPLPESDDDPVEAARDHLGEVFAVLTRVTMANRRSGGIYRWEGRYLEPGDREVVRLLFEEMIARVARQARVLHPDVPDASLDLLSAGALSVIASLTGHRTALPVGRLTATMVGAALRVIDSDVPEAGGPSAVTAPRPAPLRGSRRAEVLAAALHLFYADGYADVTIETIAARVGLTTSGFYRHFASKADVLLAACLLASDRLDAAVEAADLGSGSADESLARLVETYVAHSFSHKEQMAVYYAHVASLPSEAQSRLRSLQRDHVALWVTVLQGAQPDLGAAEARFLVLAAISTVTDLGRRLHWRSDEATLAQVSAVILAVLGGQE